MYSELMMREHGFDDGPAFRADHAHRRDLAGVPDHPRHPDAPRRDDASRRRPTSSSSRRASSGRTPAPRSSGTRTARPTRCRTCSAGRCCSGCAPTSSAGWATRSASRRFHDTLLRNGSLPISFHRRLLAGRGLTAIVQVIPAIDLERGRSRIVYWPGAAAGIGAPTDRPDRIAERFVALGRAAHPPRRLRRRPGRRAGQPRGGRRGRGPRRRPAPGRRRRRLRPRRSSSRSPPGRPGSC